MVALPPGAAAQHDLAALQAGGDSQTLFGDAVRHGGYGGLVFGATQVNGELVYLRGRRGAWIINMSEDHAISLGIGTYRTGTDFAPSSWTVPDVPQPELRTNYSGFEMEYANRSWRLVHVSVQTLVGSGRVRYSQRNLPLERTSDHYFVLQPGVNLSLNVTGWFRLTGGLMYRYASGVSLEGTSNTSLSGMSTHVLLRFGRF